MKGQGCKHGMLSSGECRRCVDGLITVHVKDGEEERECPDCLGTELKLTPLGKELLEFLKETAEKR